MKTAIFGCGIIANRVALGFKNITNNELVGFASRDIEKAKEYANKYDVKEFGDYDYFLNKKEIDAIYICTYNLNHYELIKRCLEHKKHVICEKPMVLNVKDCDELFVVAKQNNVLLMEALKSVFLPITNRIKVIISNNLIGNIHHIEASFTRNGNHSVDHWINDPRCGVLKDLGNYCVGTVNYLLETTPTIEYKYKNNSLEYSDKSAELILDYDGIKAHILVSNEYDGDSSLRIYGDNGYIVVNDFWKTGKGYYISNKQRYEINEELISDFHYEIQHFTDCVNNNILESPIMSYKASRDIISINE